MMAKTESLGPLAAAVVGLLAAVGLLIVLMMLIVEAKPAEATFPGKNGRIAYEGSGAVIYTIRPGGGGKTEVTEGEQPAFSADGKKIAYTVWDGNDAEIYTIKATGGKPFQVTNNDGEDYLPSWSPDGKRIAYTCNDGDREICTIDARGRGKPLQLTKNDTLDFGPSWSPSGKKIAYSGVDPNTGLDNRRDWEVYAINARGGGRFNVTKNETYDYYPDYSPNGKKIAYAAKNINDEDNEIRTVKATGGKPSQLTNNAKDDYDPSWSPDGKRIAYTHYSDEDLADETAAIYKIAAGGGKEVLVTDNDGTGGLDPSWGPRP